MRHCRYITKVFLLCIILLCFIVPVYAKTETIIDTSCASHGYFTIHYSDTTISKMKVGIIHDCDTTYHDYIAGDTSVYTFTEEDGHYTIALYSNVSGTKYRLITKKIVKVLLDNDLSPFLVSTKEVEFSKDDAVSQKAAEICNGLTDTSSRIIALHGYIHDTISYDYAFAADVRSGKIVMYTPKAVDVLNSQKGICYDFATLYAAMCRSQGIPCRIKKGYYQNVYHAWNEVYIDGLWYKADTTTSINKEILKKNLTKKEENK